MNNRSSFPCQSLPTTSVSAKFTNEKLGPDSGQPVCLQWSRSQQNMTRCYWPSLGEVGPRKAHVVCHSQIGRLDCARIGCRLPVGRGEPQIADLGKVRNRCKHGCPPFHMISTIAPRQNGEWRDRNSWKGIAHDCIQSSSWSVHRCAVRTWTSSDTFDFRSLSTLIFSQVMFR